MPAFPILQNTTINDGAADPSQLGSVLQVICAFPVSGQYGPGSRVLYYVLVAACIIARKAEYVRNACLAAALLNPAIAALHAIVLAAVHSDGAIDLDIYGALQFCAIGIIAAPTTVRFSRTYFENKGLGILFVWTLLILAGLIALAVEFFRADARGCTDENTGRQLFHDDDFPYGKTTCGLICSVEEGPFSPLRRGSAENIYVVPNPNLFPFGAATLVATACCIPGTLYLVWTWTKIKAMNSMSTMMPPSEKVISGINTDSKRMKLLRSIIGRTVGNVEVPVFGGAVSAIIIFGELNFWSKPMMWETEPLTNASQWSGMASALLAILGSIYIVIAEHMDDGEASVIVGSPTTTSGGADPYACSDTASMANVPVRTSRSNSNASHSCPSHARQGSTEPPYHSKALDICFPRVHPEHRVSLNASPGDEGSGLCSTPGCVSRANSFGSVVSRPGSVFGSSSRGQSPQPSTRSLPTNATSGLAQSPSTVPPTTATNSQQLGSSHGTTPVETGRLEPVLGTVSPPTIVVSSAESSGESEPKGKD
ncbi:hypothetical protein VTJ04DRAFT_10317 [Mycothermus thermophilus]|uniref:uncharacterized protein n=1 Tax=Humicola insolens TaxID=85995 RepID=UPI0037422E19